MSDTGVQQQATPRPVATDAETRAEKQRRRNAELAPIVPATVPWGAVVAFTVIALGLAWAVASPLWLTGEGLANPWFQLIALGMMYTPAIAAFVVVLFIRRPKSIPRLLGLAPLRPLKRTIGLSALAFASFPTLAFAAMLLGQAMGLIQLDFVGFSGLASIMSAQGTDVPSRDALGGIVMMSLLFIPVNIIISSLAAFGEEIGWRGWLVPNLLPLGTWPALTISGAIWGLWHAPLILLGYNYGRTDIFGVLMMVGWCALLGVIFGWLRLRSASVWPAVIAHGAVNGSASALIVFFSAGSLANGTFGTILGWSGWILLAAVIGVLVVTGQLTKRAEPGLTLADSREGARYTRLPSSVEHSTNGQRGEAVGARESTTGTQN